MSGFRLSPPDRVARMSDDEVDSLLEELASEGGRAD